MPNATVTIRELKNKETGIDLGIPSHKEIPGLLGSSVEYHIVAVTNLQCFKLPKHKDTDVVQFMVPKSVEDFEDLKKKLSAKFPGTIFPALPKRTFGLLDASIQERRTTLESFLKHIASTPKLASSQIFLQFLGLSPYKVNKQRSEEKASAAGDVTDLFEEINQDQSDDLFSDLADDDLDLFKPRTKTSPSAGALFGDSGASNEDPTRGLKLFEEQDLGGAVTKDEADNLFFVPDAAPDDPKKGKKAPDIEDNSELLTIEDDLDSLLKVQTDQKKQIQPDQKKPSLPAKPKPPIPGKPRHLGKPQISPKPKPSIKPTKTSTDTETEQVSKEQLSSSKEKPVEKLDASDILKYIETNTAGADDDLDLFS